MDMFTNGGTRYPPPPPLKLENPNLFSDCSRTTGSLYTSGDQSIFLGDKNNRLYRRLFLDRAKAVNWLIIAVLSLIIGPGSLSFLSSFNFDSFGGIAHFILQLVLIKYYLFLCFSWIPLI